MARKIWQSILIWVVVALLAGPGRAAEFTPMQRTQLFAHVPIEEVSADTDQNKLFDNLEAKLLSVPVNQPLEVIVRFKPGREEAIAAIANRVTRRLESDRSVAARFTPAEIRGLVASDAIESIEENTICHAVRDLSQASLGVTKARLELGLTGNMDGNANGYSARDIVIAVIDSGAAGNHPDFAGGKILAFRDLVNNRTTPYDDTGHGTHVASIVAGAVRTVNGVPVGGVASGAALVVVKVLEPDKGTPTDRLVVAVDWVIQNRQQYGIRVLNVSIGSPGSSGGTDAYSRALDRAVEAGIVVCVAAGNTGPSSYSIANGAASARAITVGAMYDVGRGGVALAPFSSRGPTADGRMKPDLCAPGVSILAADPSGGYARRNGTSMASPFVAGVAALILQAHPSYTPDQVKTLLTADTAEHWGSKLNQEGRAYFFGGNNEEYGAGRVDAYLALLVAANRTGVYPPGPGHLHGEGFLPGRGTKQVWFVTVLDTQYPLAVTLIAKELGADFDLRIIGPNGSVLASAIEQSRQEILSIRPSATGTYQIVVECFYGRGGYCLDISAGTRAP